MWRSVADWTLPGASLTSGRERAARPNRGSRLAHPANPDALATGVLAWCQTEPGGIITSAAEPLHVAGKRDQRAGGYRPDAGHLDEAAASLILLGNVRQLRVELRDLGFHRFDQVGDLGKVLARQVWQAFVAVPDQRDEFGLADRPLTRDDAELAEVGSHRVHGCRALSRPSHSRTALATNSGPLSDRIRVAVVGPFGSPTMSVSPR